MWIIAITNTLLFQYNLQAYTEDVAARHKHYARLIGVKFTRRQDESVWFAEDQVFQEMTSCERHALHSKNYKLSIITSVLHLLTLSLLIMIT